MRRLPRPSSRLRACPPLRPPRRRRRPGWMLQRPDQAPRRAPRRAPRVSTSERTSSGHGRRPASGRPVRRTSQRTRRRTSSPRLRAGPRRRRRRRRRCRRCRRCPSPCRRWTCSMGCCSPRTPTCLAATPHGSHRSRSKRRSSATTTTCRPRCTRCVRSSSMGRRQRHRPRSPRPRDAARRCPTHGSMSSPGTCSTRPGTRTAAAARAAAPRACAATSLAASAAALTAASHTT